MDEQTPEWAKEMTDGSAIKAIADALPFGEVAPPAPPSIPSTPSEPGGEQGGGGGSPIIPPAPEGPVEPGSPPPEVDPLLEGGESQGEEGARE